MRTACAYQPYLAASVGGGPPVRLPRQGHGACGRRRWARAGGRALRLYLAPVPPTSPDTGKGETVSQTLWRFGSDRDLRRSEDGPLLTGRGRFTDDVERARPGPRRVRPRSTAAHGDHPRAWTRAGRSPCPVCSRVLTGRGRCPRRARCDPARRRPSRARRQADVPAAHAAARGRPRALRGRVGRHRGRRDGRPRPRDAAAAVGLDLDPLPAASDVDRALAAGAPAIWPDAPGNVAFDWTDGDAAAVEAAIAGPRTWRACACTTRGWRRPRWSRARPSAQWDEAEPALHTHRLHPGRRGRTPPPRGGRVQDPAPAAPRAHARRGRRLRHEGAGLPRVRGAALRGAPGGPAGQVARDPRRELPGRHAGRDGMLEGELALDADGPLPGPARAHPRGHRRLRHRVRGDVRRPTTPRTACRACTASRPSPST